MLMVEGGQVRALDTGTAKVTSRGRANGAEHTRLIMHAFMCLSTTVTGKASRCDRVPADYCAKVCG